MSKQTDLICKNIISKKYTQRKKKHKKKKKTHCLFEFKLTFHSPHKNQMILFLPKKVRNVQTDRPNMQKYNFKKIHKEKKKTHCLFEFKLTFHSPHKNQMILFLPKKVRNVQTDRPNMQKYNFKKIHTEKKKTQKKKKNPLSF